MKRILIFLLIGIFLLAGLTAQPAGAQSEISLPTASYQFGKEITFSAQVDAPAGIKDSFLYVQEQGNPRSIVRSALITPLADNSYLLNYTLDLVEQPLRAFSTIEYRFETISADGALTSSAPQTFHYIDDRFPWQEIRSGEFTVHWYEEDRALAQTALEVSQRGLERIQSLLPISSSAPLDIYMYPNNSAMQETLLLAGRSWVAGHADPELGVIVVAVPAGVEQQILIEQRIPHELMHVKLYELSPLGFTRLPTWFNEGLASLAELFPNPDYQILLDDAYLKNKLIPMSLLCKNFPVDASGALLAYAQSASFTSYLRSTFGATRLKLLMDEYADDVDCETGIENALGKSLSQLEQGWRAERFGASSTFPNLDKFLPWLVLLAAVLAAPIGLMLAWMHRRRAPVNPAALSKNKLD